MERFCCGYGALPALRAREEANAGSNDLPLIPVVIVETRRLCVTFVLMYEMRDSSRSGKLVCFSKFADTIDSFHAAR